MNICINAFAPISASLAPFHKEEKLKTIIQSEKYGKPPVSAIPASNDMEVDTPEVASEITPEIASQIAAKITGSLEDFFLKSKNNLLTKKNFLNFSHSRVHLV